MAQNNLTERNAMPNTPTNFKGSCTAVVVIDRIIELWFSAPNGDSSDSVIFNLYCVSNAQAEEIAEIHRKVWGL